MKINIPLAVVKNYTPSLIVEDEVHRLRIVLYGVYKSEHIKLNKVGVKKAKRKVMNNDD